MRNMLYANKRNLRAGMTAMLAVSLLFGNAFVGNAETFDPEGDSIATEIVEDIGEIGELGNSIASDEPIEQLAEAEYRVVDDGEADDTVATEETTNDGSSNEPSEPAEIMDDGDQVTAAANSAETDLPALPESDLQASNLIDEDFGIWVEAFVEDAVDYPDYYYYYWGWDARRGALDPKSWVDSPVPADGVITLYPYPNAAYGPEDQCPAQGAPDPYEYSPAYCLHFDIKWFVDGKEVKGNWSADSTTWFYYYYMPTPADVGKTLKVKVTLIEPGYVSKTIESPDISIGAPIGFLPFKVNIFDSLTGVPACFPPRNICTDGRDPSGGWQQPGHWYPSTVAKVGSPLEARTEYGFRPGYSPVPPAGTVETYQWYKTDSNYGRSAIAGATTSTYTPVAEDYDHVLSVQVTSVAPGYKETTRSMHTGRVDGLPLEYAVTISGTLQVGEVLTANVDFINTDNAFLLYQWLRDGTPIASIPQGGFGWDSSYKLVAADVGAKISVTVQAYKAGYSITRVTSPATSKVSSGVITAGTARVDGVLQVGQTLTASVWKWFSPTGGTLSYQWLRDGKPIGGQVGKARTYKLVTADVGTKISVTITSSMAGYMSASATSPATAKVSGGAISAGTARVDGTLQVGLTLTASTPKKFSPADATLSYQWLRDGKAIGGQVGKASTYKLVTADVGTKISVTITASKAGYTSATVTSPATAKVSGGAITAGTARVDGLLQVGQTLTASTPKKFNPSDVTLAYQWLRDGKAIGGQAGKASSYKLVTADVGAKISVTVTASKSGYTSASVTSPATGKVSGGAITAGTARVDGVLQVGQTLTAATPKKFNPTDVTLSYQWLRDGKPIGGQAGKASAYKLVTADVDTNISVTITASKVGYTSATATSPARGTVIK